MHALKIRLEHSAGQSRRGMCCFLNVRAGNNSTMALLGPIHLRHVCVGDANVGAVPRVFVDDIIINPELSLFWGAGRAVVSDCAAEAESENLLSGQVSSGSLRTFQTQCQHGN